MMTTQAQNIFTRILFMALLPLAFFACGEESDYLLEEGFLTDEANIEQAGEMMIASSADNGDSDSSDPDWQLQVLECIDDCAEEYNQCEKRRKTVEDINDHLRKKAISKGKIIGSMVKPLCKNRLNSCIADCLD